MNRPMNSRNASSAPTRHFEKVFAEPGVATTSTSVVPCVVVSIDQYTEAKDDAPPPFRTIGTLVDEWSKDPKRGALLAQARQWVAQTSAVIDGDTVRSLRLRKGWSQTQLADAIASRQSHVARIESGTVQVTIDTCRRLCEALGIDMNTLDAALRHQEAMPRRTTAK